jgi:Rrf2 family iron-sulfur cluster assembly transcriptional regulator
MKLTTKGRYAVTAILDLAIHDGAGPVALSEIATRQGISLSYLEQLFSRLRKRGLVKSVRGPGGGYQLAREASDIAVSDVIWAVDEMVDATRCRGRENCQGEERCLTHDLWEDLSRQIRDFLSDIDLAQLVERRRVREVAARQDGMTVGAPGQAGDIAQ